MHKNIRIIIKELIKESIDFNSFNLTDKQLKDIALWGLKNGYEDTGCYDDNDNEEDVVNCVVSDFKQFLSVNYPKELGNFPDKPIIYRLVRLKNKNNLNKKELGYSWFSNLKQIENSCFFQMLDYLKPLKNKDGQIFLLKGITNIKNVDIKNTLWQRSAQWCENEIVIKNPRNIKLLFAKELKS